MGVGCTRDAERVAASLGGSSQEAQPFFGNDKDVKSAGVILALPALLANGLLDLKGGDFQLPRGYYGLQTIFLILGFMSLLRVKNIERLRYCDPGEMGKLIGLDRVPEARTLRQKVDALTEQGDPEKWMRSLSKNWMEAEPELAGSLYVDGHVRLYFGKQTKLPKRYVTRQKLCMRGVTDYWVNDAMGQPFFVVPKEVNAGMLQTLRKDIVPRLLQDIAGQPSEEELEADSDLHRFELIFDREGYSPEFFQDMWNLRIACTTYRKYSYSDWPEQDFAEKQVTFPNGSVTTMKPAEKDSYMGKKLAVREVRKLNANGHQTAVLSTNRKRKMTGIAAHMFCRWSQENFFKYMLQHYDIDRLIGYGIEEMDETVRVINPAYRQLDGEIRAKAAKLGRARAELAACMLDGGIDQQSIQDFIQNNAQLKEQIDGFEQELETMKETRKNTDKHLLFKDLPENLKFKALPTRKKYFIDTIKMIAYRAETALTNFLTPHLTKPDVARSLVCSILATDADLTPDYQNKTLHVSLHNLANPQHHRCALLLCDFLNQTKTRFPGTELTLVYDLVSSHFREEQKEA